MLFLGLLNALFEMWNCCVLNVEIRLNDFSDILTEGRLEVVAALPGEGDEAPRLPRLKLAFNRRDYGRLRQLVDALNAMIPETSSPPESASQSELPCA